MKPTLLVLAAGMGSRYGGLKQVDPVGPSGETLLDYSVFDALREGFGKVVFVIRKDLETTFREVVGSRYADRITVDYVFQELDALPDGYAIPAGRSKPWGTGHAILCAMDAIQEPFGVINADDFYGRDAFTKLAAFLSHPPATSSIPAHAIVAYRLGNTLSDHGTVSRGICEGSAEGRLMSVTEVEKIEKSQEGARCPLADGTFREFTGDEPVSMNLWGFTPAIFPALRDKFISFLETSGEEEKSEFYIPSAVDDLIKDQQATVDLLQTSSQWFGVTYREDKPLVAGRLQQLVNAGEYPASL